MGGGGGGGGGGRYTPPSTKPACEPDWACDPWGDCIEGEREQRCVDLNSCEKGNTVKINTRECSEHCNNGIKDFDEEDIDCGGECRACDVAPGSIKIIADSTITLGFQEPTQIQVTLENVGAAPLTSVTALLKESQEKLVVGELSPGASTQVTFTIDPLAHDLSQAENEALAIIIREGESDISRKTIPYTLTSEKTIDPILRICDAALAVSTGCQPGEGVLYVVIDNRDSDKDQTGVEVVYSIEKDGRTLFAEVLGPYKAENNELAVRHKRLTTLNLAPDLYQSNADIYIKGERQEERITTQIDLTTTQVTGEGIPAWFYFLLAFIVVTVVGAYFAIQIYMQRGEK
ncbi:MAG: hypothetical protein HC945_04380 [Nitrosarchaeum sp.]|nr:hypothetical protein [Nitrosarchaeum sp.]